MLLNLKFYLYKMTILWPRIVTILFFILLLFIFSDPMVFSYSLVVLSIRDMLIKSKCVYLAFKLKSERLLYR